MDVVPSLVSIVSVDERSVCSVHKWLYSIVRDDKGNQLPGTIQRRPDDGQQEIKFEPTRPGKYKADVRVNGAPVKGSPLPLEVVPETPIDFIQRLSDIPTKSGLKIPLEIGEPGKPPKSVLVDCIKPVSGIAPSSRTVRPKIGRSPDGTYLMESPHYLPPGEYVAAMVVDGVPTDAPFVVGPAVQLVSTSSPIRVNKENSVPLKITDISPEKLQACVLDPSGKKLEGVKLETLSPGGSPVLKFTPENIGPHTVEVTDKDGQPVYGSPQNVDVQSPAVVLVGPASLTK